MSSSPESPLRRSESPAIVYVDGDPASLHNFEQRFSGRFRVIGCSSGTKALERLSSEGEVAVLLSEQHVPGMTGIELLERARPLNPNVQRMVIADDSELQAVMEAVLRGEVSRYFVKPYLQADLSAALGNAVRIHTLQKEVKGLEERLANAERLASLGLVSVGISHELMNPVSYVSQNVSSLRREFEVLREFIGPAVADSAVRRTLQELPQMLGDIESGTRHIRAVAMGVRRQAVGTDEQTSCDVTEIVEFAVKLARAEVGQRARLLTQGQSIEIAGGPVKLCQVLLNLIINAAQAMEGSPRPGLINVRWVALGSRVLLEIEDNGPGVPPELLSSVFEPLFSTKPASVGTGMGLSICRELVEGLGGEISLKSRLGQGTTVEIRLPKI